MPRHWTKKHKIDYKNETEEEIKRKQFDNRIVADTKPYFMGYIYPKMLEDHKKYQKKNNTKVLRRFGRSLNELMDKDDKTEEEKNSLVQYSLFQPTLKNRCVMNELCSYIEQADFDLKFFKSSKSDEFDYTSLLYDDYLVRKRSVLYERVDSLMKSYKNKLQDINFSTNLLKNTDVGKKFLDEFVQEVGSVNYMYFLERDIERIGIKTPELFNYFVELIYNKHKSGFNVLWDIFSEDILSKLDKGRIVVPVADINGDIEYFGEKYRLLEVSSKKIEVLE